MIRMITPLSLPSNWCKSCDNIHSGRSRSPINSSYMLTHTTIKAIAIKNASTTWSKDTAMSGSCPILRKISTMTLTAFSLSLIHI